MNGLGTEGIFRIPADYDEVMSVKCRYDQWEPGTCSDAHVPAALLKQWLRELYIPLTPQISHAAVLLQVAAPSGGDAPPLSATARAVGLHRLASAVIRAAPCPRRHAAAEKARL